MAGQGRGRSVEQWNALTPGNRRRWIRAFGSEDAALEAYRNGLSLTTEQRGHARTPERPINALLRPWQYPDYVARHTDQLNELARRRGLPEHGAGPRGESPETRDYKKAGGDFTWVVPPGVIPESEARFSTVFRTIEEAQLFARRSWAPAGVVWIVDRGAQYVWRYEVWFYYPLPTRSSRPGRTNRSTTPSRNRKKKRQAYHGEKSKKKT